MLEQALNGELYDEARIEGLVGLIPLGFRALGTAQIVNSAASTFPEAVRYSCINRKF